MLYDVRFAFRTLRHNPAFALVAIISLALGIGATASIFALADALILRPLPVPNSSGVLSVESQTRGEGITGLYSFSGLSYPDFKDLRERNQSFSGLAASRFANFGFAAEQNDIPKGKFGAMVSANFFRVMQIQPKLGRDFRSDEDLVPGRDAVAILSEELWRNELGSSPDVIGKIIFLNAVPFTVIGVAPEGFTGPHVMLRCGLYIPAAMAPRLASDPQQSSLDRRDDRGWIVQGRLKPGVTIGAATAEANVIGGQLARAYPETNRNRSLVVETNVQARLHQDTFDAMLVTLLMALAAVVLLIACANVMNLMLSRAKARSREIAVRLAVGAGRGRLVRQLLTESLIVALLGGALGLLMAQAGVSLFSQMRVPTDVPIVIEPRLDERVLLFSLLAAGLSAILFGLAPALQSTRPDLVPALKAGRSNGGKRYRLLGRNALVVAQVAGSLFLLILATQAYRGAAILLSSPLGFRTDHLLLASFDPSLARYQTAQTQEFYKRLLERTRTLTGVRTAALTQTVPLMPAGVETTGIVPDGVTLPPATEALNVLSDIVSDGYFETVGMTIVEGREFQISDRGDTPKVAIVNEQFARKYYPNRSALGKRLRLASANGHPIEIVGVARQSKYLFPAEPRFEYLYLPFAQNPRSGMTLMVQTVGPSGVAADPVRNLVREIDRAQPVLSLRTMEDFYEQRANKTMQVLLDTIGGMGLLGLILALVGLYGLITYSVGLRQREIGIRMAIGADQHGVQRMILKQGLMLGSGGCIIGLVLTLLAGRPIAVLIDAPSFYLPLVGLVFVALLAITALSAYIPARRASMLDPNLILRQE